MVNNPYGKHSFYDLDESWYRYMMADREERKQMCKDILDADDFVLGIGVVVLVVLGIVALCCGII